MKAEKKARLDLSDYSVEEAVAKLNEVYGQNTLIIASQAKAVELKHISTGAYALDLALAGGWPENRIIEVRGPYSSFKSTISLMSLRNFQRKYEDGYGLYIDLEKTFDRIYAEALGVDLDRLVIVNPDSGEQAIDVLNDLMKLSYPLWAILDSIAALIPSAEIDGDMSQQFMGLQARLVNRAMRVLTARLKRNMYDEDAPSTTVLCLNQLRSKIGVMFGNPETAPGGMGKEFACSILVRLSASAAKEAIIQFEEKNQGVTKMVRYGQRVDFKVLKNKCGGPQHEEGDFIFYEKPYKGYRRYSINNQEALFRYGAFHGIIELTMRGYSYGGLVAKKKSKFVEKLKANRSVAIQLYTDLLAAMKPVRKSVKIVKDK
jgi:recombination protein RecA